MTHVGQSTRNSKTFIYISNYAISLFKHVADGSDGPSRVLNGSGRHPPPVGGRLSDDAKSVVCPPHASSVSVDGSMLRGKCPTVTSDKRATVIPGRP